jgi:hypothetical protein
MTPDDIEANRRQRKFERALGKLLGDAGMVGVLNEVHRHARARATIAQSVQNNKQSFSHWNAIAELLRAAVDLANKEEPR